MKKYFPVYSWLLFFSFLFQQKIDAQESLLNFTNYSSKDGLSSGTVYDIIKDSFGFLWLATEDGLNRFDGSNFKVYRHNPSNPVGLRVNHITALFEDKKGRLWIGTNGGGLSYYDRNKDSIFNYLPDGINQIAAAVNSLDGDREGNIFVSCYGGLFKIDGSSYALVINGKDSKLTKALSGVIILSLMEDSRHRKWVGTNVGLYLYDKANDNLTVYKHVEGNPLSLPGDDINRIAEDSAGNIWVGGEHGVSMMMADGKNFQKYTHTSTTGQLSSNTVFAMAADTRNRLWIGTDEGLNILDISTKTVTVYVPDNRSSSSLSSRSIRSLFFDPGGIYWVGTFRGGLHKYDENFNYFNLKDYNAFDPFGLRSPIVTAFAAHQAKVFVGTDGGGLQLYDRQTGLLEHVNLPIPSLDSKHDLTILALEMDRNDKLWIGTFINGLYCYDPSSKNVRRYTKGAAPTDLNNNDIFCLKEDTKGNMWVATNGAGINVIRTDNTLIDKYVNDPSRPNDQGRPSSNYIRCFEEDTDGHMWVGTFGSGVSVFDPGSQQFTFYNKLNSGLPSDYVSTIKQDKAGNIWIGTSGNGMGLLEKGSKRFEAIGEKEGLINGNVQKIIEDASGKLWISTNSGLSCYDPRTKIFKNYTAHNGLQTGAFVPLSGLRLTDGELFFGGQNGFNHFNPTSFTTNKNIPPVVLTNLTIDNQVAQPQNDGPIDKPIQLAEELRLSYKQAFSIAFEALDFTVPAANQYEYMLKGFDKNWISAGKEHSAYYANIPPGSYTFIVRASNNDGVWNKEGKSIRVVVAPPLWRTTYAYILYFLLAAAALYFIRRRGIQKIRLKYVIDQERKEAKMLIERQRQEAEYLHKLDQVKIKFLTNLSHEFRTPISLIMGPVDNLMGHIKGESLLNQLNLIKRNSRRLLNLVNQLLDFRKMEERELKLQCTDGDIVSFTKDICDSFNDLARRKKIDFGFYTKVSALRGLFDHDKVERILFNLLSNAFKFTPEHGNISVSLQASEDIAFPDSYAVSLVVKDSGIGIPAEVQPHIFESFFQHETGSEILNHGTGIGLSITREFVHLHGGSITVESEVGKGSAFICSLSMKRIADINQERPRELITTDEQPENSNTTTGDSLPPALLIVEDDDDFRFYLKENLKNVYRIYEAPNGRDGWQRALFHHPDIIVCDVQMPVMNGLELVQKLKADKRTKHIPLLLLTAANTPHGMLDGLESGAIDYMTKPFDFAVLQAKINNILLLNQSLKDTYSKQVTVSLPETEILSEKDRFLQKTLSFIYENLNNPQLSVELLSAHMSVSRASLYSKLLEFTGMTPVEFIRSVKLDKAKELLEKSDMTVSAIATETGFANSNYFTKVFKTKYNVTPSDYQEEKRKK
ncbi:MAG: two-component regulator propeller domain-containing protein [Bacteroidota bacterium]